MADEEKDLTQRVERIEDFNAAADERRRVLTQIRQAIQSATSEQQVSEQLQRLAAEVELTKRLSTSFPSLQTAQTANVILDLLSENSRLYGLATRKLAEILRAGR